jgi:hypothetical protein
VPTRLIFSRCSGPVNGAVRYADMRREICSLHPWGGRDQPGFQRTTAEHARTKPMTVRDVTAASGNGAQSPAAEVLLSARDLECQADAQQTGLAIFNAALIDEGQTWWTNAWSSSRASARRSNSEFVRSSAPA